MAFFLQRAHDLDLVSGGHAGENGDIVYGGGQLFRIHSVKLCARHGFALEPEFSCDG